MQSDSSPLSSTEATLLTKLMRVKVGFAFSTLESASSSLKKILCHSDGMSFSSDHITSHQGRKPPVEELGDKWRFTSLLTHCLKLLRKRALISKWDSLEIEKQVWGLMPSDLAQTSPRHVALPAVMLLAKTQLSFVYVPGNTILCNEGFLNYTDDSCRGQCWLIKQTCPSRQVCSTV